MGGGPPLLLLLAVRLLSFEYQNLRPMKTRNYCHLSPHIFESIPVHTELKKPLG